MVAEINHLARIFRVVNRDSSNAISMLIYYVQLGFLRATILIHCCAALLCRQEKLEMEAKSQNEEKPLDYLEPFLAQLNPDDIRDGKLTRQQAYKLREDCLAHLKQRLIEKANLIQSRFEKVSVVI